MNTIYVPTDSLNAFVHCDVDRLMYQSNTNYNDIYNITVAMYMILTYRVLV